MISGSIVVLIIIITVIILGIYFMRPIPNMKLEVRLDQKIIYESSFAIYRKNHSDSYDMIPEKSLSFIFNAPRAIVWQGYKDDDEITAIDQKIECDVWLAGTDSDLLILGVSFMGQNSCYMNTLHIVHPGLREESIIASGLVIITVPVDEKLKKPLDITQKFTSPNHEPRLVIR